MKKINFEDNNYFIGEDEEVYKEIENILVYTKDNLKRYVVQLNEEEKKEFLEKTEELLNNGK